MACILFNSRKDFHAKRGFVLKQLHEVGFRQLSGAFPLAIRKLGFFVCVWTQKAHPRSNRDPIAVLLPIFLKPQSCKVTTQACAVGCEIKLVLDRDPLFEFFTVGGREKK